MAGNLSTDDALINGLFHGRETFLATSRWIDYATVACMSPPWPGLLNSTQNITTGRNCSIAVSNDHGNTVDTDAYANAARVGFTYTDKKPTLNSDGGFWESGDGADVDAFAATTEDGIETADGENAATGSPKGLHLLKVNFDDALLIASEETKHFERMYFQIPSTCSTLAGNREKYRQMREEGTSRGFPKAGGTTVLPPCS